MAKFASSRNGTFSTGAGAGDVFLMTALTARKMEIEEFSLIGNGATSAAAAYMEVAIKLATGAAGAAGTAITPVKLEADSAASACFTNHTMTTDAAVGGANTAILLLGCNNYGGIYRWTARPGGAIKIRNIAGTGVGAAGSLATRNNNANNSAVYSFHSTWDEV